MFRLVYSETLFSRLVIRAYSWTQELCSHVVNNAENEPELFTGYARFFFDNEHDFVLHMSSPHLSRIKVQSYAISTLRSVCKVVEV